MPGSGAPGRLEAGDVEMGGGAVGVGLPEAGGPVAALAATDWLAVEVGGEFSSSYSNRWALGWAGARFTPWNEAFGSTRLALDLDLGAGAGKGGELSGNEQQGGSCTQPPWDGRPWFDRLAYGGYLGLGFGARWSWFSIFARSRAQVTRATNIPPTFWWATAAGVQFLLGDRLAIYLDTGSFGYVNEIEDLVLWMYEFGLAVKLAPPAQAPPA
jgi:hypothetical protein